MTVKERLIQYLLYKNISQGAFEKRVGLGNGYINNISRSPSDTVTEGLPAFHYIYKKSTFCQE